MRPATSSNTQLWARLIIGFRPTAGSASSPSSSSGGDCLERNGLRSSSASLESQSSAARP